MYENSELKTNNFDLLNRSLGPSQEEWTHLSCPIDIGSALTCPFDPLVEPRILSYDWNHWTMLDYILFNVNLLLLWYVIRTLTRKVVTFYFRNHISHPKTFLILYFLSTFGCVAPTTAHIVHHFRVMFLFFLTTCYAYLFRRGYLSKESVKSRTPITLKVRNVVLDSQSSLEVYDWAQDRRGDYNKRKENQKRKQKKQKKAEAARNNRSKSYKSQSGETSTFQRFKDLWSLVTWFREWASLVYDVSSPIKLLISALTTSLSHLRKSELFVCAQKLFFMACTIGILSCKEFTFRGFKVFGDNNLRRPVSLLEVVDCALELLTLFWTRFLAFCETFDIRSFWMDTLSDRISEEYTFLVTNFVMVDAGRVPTERVDPSNPDSEVREVPIQNYDRRLNEFVTTLNLKLACCRDNEKSGYTAKLREIKLIITKRTLAIRKAARIKPFALLVYGGSGVAKSSIITSIMRAILKMNNFDAAPESIITLNETDKFQSEYRSYHSGVIFDDLCNMKASETQENPLNKVISFINTIPMAALNPNVELKGNVMIEPKMVCATTNVKHLDSAHWSNEPLVILRRFDYIITQEIRPEYQKASGMLDTSKVQHMLNEPFPDFALFTVEICRKTETSAHMSRNKVDRNGKSANTNPVQYDTVQYEGKPLVQVDLKTLMRFLRDTSKEYYAEQQKIADAKNAMEDITLCKSCCLPPHICDCGEVLDDQAMFFDLLENVTSALLNFEQTIMDIINEKFISTLLSTPCLIILALSNLEALIAHLTDLYYNHVILFVLMLLFDMFFRVGQIFIFGLLFLTLFSMLNSTKLFAVRIAMEYPRFRRPSEVWVDSPVLFRAKILAGFIALFGFTAVKYLISYFSSSPMATSEACETINVSVMPKTDVKKASKWAFWDTVHREEKYVWKPDTTQRAKCTTLPQAKGIMQIRQWTMILHDSLLTASYCNCVPITSCVLLIPGHMVPKRQCEVTLVRPDRTHRATLCESKVYRIPGTDYAVWYCSEIGTQKDISYLFADIIAAGKSVQFDLLYHDRQHGFKELGTYSGTSTTTRSTKGGSFPSYVYHKYDGTFNGLCMATAMSYDFQGLPFIAGFHLAGKDSKGAIGALSRQQLVDAIHHLGVPTSRLIPHSQDVFDSNIAGIEIGLSPEVDPKHPVSLVEPNSNINIIGSHKMPVGKFNKSDVRISKISEHVEKVLSIKRQHGPVATKGDIKHKVNDLNRRGNTAYDFDEECFQKAVLDLRLKLEQGLTKEDYATLGKLPNDAILAGFDGVQGINRMALSTSMGFPFRGKKSNFIHDKEKFVEGITAPLSAEKWMWDELEKREDLHRDGKRSNSTFKASLKDEATKLTKDKERVFAGSDVINTMEQRKYFLTFSSLMQRHMELFECAVGIDVHSPEFTRIMNYVGAHGEDRIIAGDYKAFDGQMANMFMLAVGRLIIDTCMKSGNYSEDDKMIMQGLISEICMSTVDYFGVVVNLTGSNPSGHPLTVVMNSLVNSLYMRYTYYVIAKEDKWWKTPLFHTVVNLITYGDDNEMGVKPGYDAFNHTRIAKTLARSEIIYTMADKDAQSVPFINIKDASFLKHYPVWNPDINMYGARIEDGSIAKMLHTHMDSDALSEEQQCVEALRNVARAWFGFGRAHYEANIDKLYEIADAAGIRGILGDLYTYDERVVMYKKKFKLAEYADFEGDADIPDSYNSLESQSEETQSRFAFFAKQLAIFGISYTATTLWHLHKAGLLKPLMDAIKELISYLFTTEPNSWDAKGARMILSWMNWFAKQLGYYNES